MVKSQAHFKIDSDILDRFRKICLTGGFEYSEVVEGFIRAYVDEWDRTLSKRVASYTTGKTPTCECGHPISTLWERCIYCGRYNSWRDCDPHIQQITDEEWGQIRSSKKEELSK